jgi:DNA-binding GntR family transcriptional regulator
MLVGASLATAEGQRGFRVAPLSLADFREVTDLRKLMETMALRESIALGDEAWEAGVVAAFDQLSQVNLRKMRHSEAVHREWQVRNNAFHEALVAASPSKWVQRFRRMLYQHAERYRAQHLVHANVRPGVRQEHKGIMDAALARNADLACRLTEAHIERTYTKVAELFAEGKTDFSA